MAEKALDVNFETVKSATSTRWTSAQEIKLATEPGF
jgi:hypothetical protein